MASSGDRGVQRPLLVIKAKSEALSNFNELSLRQKPKLLETFYRFVAKLAIRTPLKNLRAPLFCRNNALETKCEHPQGRLYQ
jgi:hypothetical protein